MKRLSLFAFLWVCFNTMLYAAPLFVEGKDYMVLPKQAQLAAPSKPGVVTVTEFFSYGCPWCYKIEDELEAWRRKLPTGVIFSRVPVIYEKGWDIYAKAYVTAEILGKQNVFTPKLFAAIHKDKAQLDTAQAMMKFFVDNGVKEKVAKSAFYSSPTVNNKVKEGMQLMQIFRINSVPSLVINNHYRVDIAMMAGDTEKMFRVAGFLVAKELTLQMMHS